RRVESKFYSTRTQGLRREASHPLRQVAKMISVRIDRPDDVAHRVNGPPRHGGDQRQPLADLWITRRRLLSQYVAEAGDQRKVRPDVVMKVRCDARAHSL